MRLLLYGILGHDGLWQALSAQMVLDAMQPKKGGE